MTEGDLDAILRLETDTPEAPQWERATYEGFCEDSPAKQLFVAADDDRLAGFVAAQIVVDVCGLESIAVGAATRRTGVGSALLTTLINWARQRGASRMQLEVRAENISAIGFYEHAGFRRDGLRRKYYQNPEEDAVLMSRVL